MEMLSVGSTGSRAVTHDIDPAVVRLEPGTVRPLECVTDFVLDEIENDGGTADEVGRSEIDGSLRFACRTRKTTAMTTSPPPADTILAVLSICHDQDAIDLARTSVESGIDTFLRSTEVHENFASHAELRDVATVRPPLEIAGHWLELSRDPLD
jgi:hypothetical protein